VEARPPTHRGSRVQAFFREKSVEKSCCKVSKCWCPVGWLVGWLLCPSKSGLMNKHIVKHIVSKAKFQNGNSSEGSVGQTFCLLFMR